MSRRTFVGSASAGAASLAFIGAGASSANAQLVYARSDWQSPDFDKLLKHPARVKQVYDVRPIGEGKFLNNIKNSLNGFHFGFGIPVDQIKIVSAMHGPANMLNYDDHVWEKYRLGEWLKVTDPKTGQPAMRNIFYTKKASVSTSSNPNDESSSLQDTSIEALQGRGVQFLSCHTATEEQVRALAKDYSLKEPFENIVKDIQSHALPGVLIVPAMVAVVSLLQSDGHYTYITV